MLTTATSRSPQKSVTETLESTTTSTSTPTSTEGSPATSPASVQDRGRAEIARTNRLLGIDAPLARAASPAPGAEPRPGVSLLELRGARAPGPAALPPGIEPAKLAWAKAWLAGEKKLYVGGALVPARSGQTFETTNPATQEVLAQLPESSPADVDAAVSAARAAFESPEWRGTTRKARRALLQGIAGAIREHRAELATLEALDNGKTYVEAYRDDMADAADVLEYYAGWTDKHYGETTAADGPFINLVQREPIGVCGLIVPWNFPLSLACWKLAPALAMGNTAVIKPAPFTSLSLLRLCEIIHEKQLVPPGVINLVLGGAEPGERLSRHLDVDKVSFTGSTAVGKKVVEASAASNLKTVSLELGGKSPVILFDDTEELEGAIQRCFTALFSHKAEKCSEPTRFLIQEGIYDRVATRMAELADGVVCGDPFDPRTDQGAQCNEAQLSKILHYVEEGKREGAKLLAGGARDTTGDNAKGYFVRPTIFGDARNDMKIAQEEIFGPVATLIPFKTEAEAVRLANDTIYGLAAGVYTANNGRAMRVARALDSGQVFVNRYGCYDYATPFGGVKQSGWKREMGVHSLDEYTRVKSIWIHHG